MTDEESFPEEYEQPSQGSSLRARGCGVIGCLVLILLLVAIGAGVYFGGKALEPLADKYLWTPSDVVREYLAAYDDGDMERARHFLCSGIANGPALNPGAPFGATSSDSFVDDTFPFPRPNGQIAIYYGSRVPGSTLPKRAQALLEREDAGWRICALRI